MNKINNVTLGADPEVFLKDFDGEYIPSIGKFGGTKEEPLPISKNGHAIQEDNVALEFNIPPSADAETFNRNISFVLEEINKRANEIGLNIAIDASGEFSPIVLMNDAAKAFGCEPDYNAWIEDENVPPNPEGNLRTCGGHIHIGYDDPSGETNIKLIKAMDLFLGIPSLYMDNDTRRRTMYGNSGCFRDKSFGAEYRVLSNFWLRSEELIKWAFNNTIKAIEFVNSGKTISEDDSALIQHSIDSSDKNTASVLVKKYSLNIIKSEQNVEIM